MKRFWKLGLLMLFSLLCVGALAGCGTFDAAGLVKGNIDLIYLNQYTDDYLKSVDLTKEEANQEYEDGIAVEVSYFVGYFDIDLDYCDADIEPQITELYHQIYDYSKYEVGEAVKNGDTYLVEVTVYPIDIFQQVLEEDSEAFSADWAQRNADGEFETQEAFETAWAQGIIDMVSARLNSIGYQEPQTISVQVSKGDDGLYSIADNDFSRIDSLIIAY